MSSRIKVVAPDRGRAFVLAGLLAGYGAEVSAENGDQTAVQVDTTAESDVSVILTVIEDWLRDEDVREARVEIGKNAYTMSG